MSSRGVVAAVIRSPPRRAPGRCARAATPSTRRSPRCWPRCVTESPLTGLGAGGYMLVHTDAEEPSCSTSSSPPPVSSGIERSSELVPVPVHFTADIVAGVQRRRRLLRGARHPGRARARRSQRFGSMPLGRARRPRRRRLAREGVVVNAEQAYFLEILAPILTHYRGGARDLRAGGPAAASRRHGSASRRSATRSSASAPTAPSPSTAARSRRPISAWVLERRRHARRRRPGGLRADRAGAGRGQLPRARDAHQPAAVLGRDPDRLRARAARAPRPAPVDAEADRGRVMEAAQARARTRGVHRRRSAEEAVRTARFLAPDRLGSTTHITAIDADGALRERHLLERDRLRARRPATPGIHLNNMLGEQDLNPLGFHALRGRAAGCPR